MTDYKHSFITVTDTDPVAFAKRIETWISHGYYIPGNTIGVKYGIDKWFPLRIGSKNQLIVKVETDEGLTGVGEALKHGGVTNMMDRLSNPAKIRAHILSEELKNIMTPLFEKHMDDIMRGEFSGGMMEDWDNDDEKLLGWRKETGETAFEQAENTDQEISEQEYFDNGQLSLSTSFVDGKYDGPLIRYFENGQIQAKGYHREGEYEGAQETYYENGQLKSGHHDHRFHTGNRVARCVSVGRGQRTFVAGVHGLQHVDNFLAAGLADDDAVGTHTQGVLQTVAGRYLALAFDVGRTAFHPAHMGLLELKFCGILDGQDTFGVVDKG